MHVLIVPSGHFITQGYPLGGIFQRHQAEALIKAGYKVGVISPGIISSRFLLKSYKYLKQDYTQSFPIYRHYIKKLYPQRWTTLQSSVLLLNRLGIELYKKYRDRYGRPDVVHAHGIKNAGFIAQKIKDLDNVPFIITEHSSEYMCSDLPAASIALIENMLVDASSLTAVSGALAEAMMQKISVKGIKVLQNVIDAAVIEVPLHKKKRSEFTFLNIASLTANKNQAMLIEVFAASFRGKKVRLRIGGTGPLGKYLKKLATTLGVICQIDFLGHLNRQSVIREMQFADCFVLSSFKETFGVVLIEALASGTPVIATQCGGANDIVTCNNGLLIESGNGAALEKAMMRIINEKQRYLPEALRYECNCRFGKEVFISQVQKLYMSALTCS